MGSYGTPIIPFGVILGKADKISIANEEIQVLHQSIKVHFWPKEKAEPELEAESMTFSNL